MTGSFAGRESPVRWERSSWQRWRGWRRWGKCGWGKLARRWRYRGKQQHGWGGGSHGTGRVLARVKGLWLAVTVRAQGIHWRGVNADKWRGRAPNDLLVSDRLLQSPAQFVKFGKWVRFLSRFLLYIQIFGYFRAVVHGNRYSFRDGTSFFIGECRGGGNFVVIFIQNWRRWGLYFPILFATASTASDEFGREKRNGTSPLKIQSRGGVVERLGLWSGLKHDLTPFVVVEVMSRNWRGAAVVIARNWNWVMLPKKYPGFRPNYWIFWMKKRCIDNLDADDGNMMIQSNPALTDFKGPKSFIC